MSASPGKEHFSNDELSLLQAVAFQIGSAIDRMRLYAAEQRRAHQFARLGEFSRALGAASGTAAEPERLTALIVTLIKEHLDWSFAAIIESTPSGSFILGPSMEMIAQQNRIRNLHCLTVIGWKVARDRHIVTASGECGRLAGIEGFKELLPASLSLVQAVPISLA